MATWTYDESIRRVLQHEGDYVNHPSDPGGPTNYGITLAVYRQYVKATATATDVRNMPLSSAKAIYKKRYWDKMRCDELPPGVDYAIFDYGVNSGTGRAPKVLKRVLGLDATNATVTNDVIEAAKKRSAKALLGGVCDERMRFLQALRTYPTFGAGWARRVRDVRAAGSAMVDRGAAPPTAPASTVVPEPIPGRGQIPESPVAKEAIRSGAPAAAVVGGFTFWGWVQAHPKTSIVIGFAIVFFVIIALVELNKWRDRKQEEPMPDTPVVPEENQP